MCGQHLRGCKRYCCIVGLWLSVQALPAGFQVFKQSLRVAAQQGLKYFLLRQIEGVKPAPPMVVDQLMQ